MNRETNLCFFQECLQPMHPEGEAHYAEFLAKLAALGRDPKLLWYPSSDQDYRDLLHLHPDRFPRQSAVEDPVVETFPDVYIHTDYLPWRPENFWSGAYLFDGRRTRIRAVRITPLQAPDLGLEVCPALVDFPTGGPDTGKIVLMDAEVESDVLGRFERTVVYFASENISFFLAAVLRRGLTISHLVNIRDGSGLGGGGKVNFKFLWFFLGRMGTEYLISDNLGRSTVHLDLALGTYPELRRYFAQPDNRPVLLQGRLELPWSRYGIFQGDAHIFRVTPFPMGHPQTETEQWDQTIEVTGRESEVNPV
ncbi:MAG TPA: hypothetical protein PLU25_15375 [Acidobacteriota bacterium]|nr:hypothetical protein [Acidobacteriota bacterium]